MQRFLQGKINQQSPLVKNLKTDNGHIPYIVYSRGSRFWQIMYQHILRQLHLEIRRLVTPVSAILVSPVSTILVTPVSDILVSPVSDILVTPVSAILVSPVSAILVIPVSAILVTPVSAILL